MHAHRKAQIRLSDLSLEIPEPCRKSRALALARQARRSIPATSAWGRGPTWSDRPARRAEGACSRTFAVGHSFTNINQTFDQIGPGSAGISWTISGVRTRSGQPFALARANRWTSSEDIAFEATDELFVALYELASQDFEPIEFTGLAVDDVSVEQTVRRYRVERVLWARNARRFADVERLRVRRGDTVRARIELRALDDGSLRTERMSFRVPGGRRRGVIRIAGGATLAAEQAGVVGTDEEGEAEPDSLDALLADLVSAPRNDALIGRASFRRAPIVLIEDRVVLGSDRVRLTIARRR